MTGLHYKNKNIKFFKKDINPNLTAEELPQTGWKYN
jgi:hypothetical protein